MRPWRTAEIRQTESATWARAANEAVSSTIEVPSSRLLRREQRHHLHWELESAREVQERLFPQAVIRVPGLEYAGRCRPAESVGGDYFDFVAMRDGRLGLAVGDVSGKGIPAALLMASLQAAVRGLAMSPARALSALMVNLNRLMHSMTPSNRYATLFFAAYESESREFSYVNCGHNAPMLFRGAKILRLNDGGPAVGMFASARYTQARITLQAGDMLLIFTDGVSEAKNSEDQEFGDTRLSRAGSRSRELPASDLLDYVFAACDEFTTGALQHDDMTLLAVRAL